MDNAKYYIDKLGLKEITDKHGKKMVLSSWRGDQDPLLLRMGNMSLQI